MNRLAQIGLGGLSLLVSSACAMRDAVPPERIASSEAAVRAAEQRSTSGPENASAALHLRLARDELELARQRMNESPRRAELLLIRARVDAELAQSLASTTAAEQQARELRIELERMQAALGEREPSRAPQDQDDSTDEEQDEGTGG
ncbi:DUF4398 domain-containing protein [Myxococcota bacterium]|nr:DUF4398 domain-containing protein [Myxococcota bacterium]